MKKNSNKRQRFSLVKQLVLADIVTLGNSSTGIASIICSIKYSNTLLPIYIYYATLLSFCSLFCDFMDGRIARTYSKSPIGQDLDSLADVISFGVAPAILGFCIGLSEPLDIIILIAFVNCGVLRLARFNTTTPTPGKAYFEGTPIPTTVLLSFLLSLCLVFNQAIINDVWNIGFGWKMHPIVLIFGISGILQASKTIRVSKF